MLGACERRPCPAMPRRDMLVNRWDTAPPLKAFSDRLVVLSPQQASTLQGAPFAEFQSTAGEHHRARPRTNGITKSRRKMSSRELSSATSPPKSKTVVCKVCHVTSPSQKHHLDHVRGRRHKSKVVNRHPYRCRSCAIVLFSFQDFRRHNNSKGHRRNPSATHVITPPSA